MGRVYQLLARFSVLIWIVMPCVGQSINNIISSATSTGVGLTGVTGIGTTEVLLYTNLTASYKGKTYKFPQSTTAGFAEMQALFPFIETNLPNQISFRLADNGNYNYSTQIIFTNGVTLRGQGPTSSFLRYVGPTNIVTLSSITNVARQTVENNAYLATTNDVLSCGLICGIGVSTVPSAPTATNFGGFYNFQDVGFVTSTNFPCVQMFIGVCQYLDMFHCGFWTQDSYNPINGYNSFYQNGSFQTNSLVLPLWCHARNVTRIVHSYFANQATGLMFGGNAAINLTLCTFSYFGDFSMLTNGYTLSCPGSILAIPFGTFVQGNSVLSCSQCDNTGQLVDYICAGPMAEFYGMNGQSIPGSFNEVGGLDTSFGGAGLNVQWNSIYLPGGNIPICCLTKDGGGNWVASTTNSDIVNKAAMDFSQITAGQGGVSVYSNNKLVFQVSDSSGVSGINSSTMVNPFICNSNVTIGSSTFASNNIGVATFSSNTLAVASTGVTNNTGINYLLTITAGTGMTLKDAAGHTIITPVLNETIPLKSGWGVVGTGMTAHCIAQ